MSPPNQQGTSPDTESLDGLSPARSGRNADSSPQASPPFLEAVLDTLPELVFVFDEENGVIWGNRGLQTKTGYSADALQGMDPSELFRGADARAVRQTLDAVREGKDTATVEVTLITREGEAIPCTFTGRPVADGSDRTGSVVGVGRDLSVLEAKEREVRRERDRLAALYSGFPSPVVHYEVREEKALVRGVNTAFEAIFGLSEAEIMGQNLDVLITPDGQARQAKVLTEQAVEEGSVQAEVVRETKDGPHYFRLNSVLFSGSEQPEGFAIYTDITEQKEREQTLREEQDALRAMYRITADQEASFEEKVQRFIDLGREYLNLPHGFLTRISDDTQKIVRSSGDHPLLQPDKVCSLSDSYCRKTLEEESLWGVQNASEEGWKNDPAYEKFELEAYIGAQILVEGELYGTLCFAATEPRENSFTERERTFVELITHWASYELEQRRATEQLEHQNERLNSFASIVSHDLRTPLNVAKGRLEIAKTEKDPCHLASLGRALDRMDELIEDVLALTWGGQDLDSDDLVSCNLARLAEKCWDHVDMSQATLRTEEELIIKANEGRLQRLLENLFRNSVEHGGDTVTVRVGSLDDGFFIEDDGPGIPEDKRGKVFDHGYSSEKEGTGLGLNIVQTIAEAHGWTLSVTDGREGGARFEVRGVEMVSSSE